MVIDKIIFSLGIIMLPFIQSFNVINIPAPFQTISFSIFCIGFIIWSIYSIKHNIRRLPAKNIQAMLALFLIVLFISALVNIGDLFSMKFKGMMAINRFIMEYGLMMLYVFLLIYIYNIMFSIDNSMDRLHKCVIYSFMLAGLYGVFELVAYTGSDIALSLLHSIDMLFRSGNEEITLQDYFRIRSLTKEPSNFAVYSVIIMPWLFSGMFVFKKRKIIGAFISIFIILNIFSFSRTGYVILLVEAILFGILFYDYYKKWLSYNFCFLSLLFWVLIGVYGMQSELVNFDSILRVFESLIDYDSNISNISRYGAQVAAWNMFLDYPIFGCGFSLYPFHVSEYYPDWAWASTEIQNWGTNFTEKDIWAPAFNFFTRLLAETGIIGFLSFCTLWFYNIYRLIKINFRYKGKDLIYIKCLICSCFGATFSFINGSDILFIEWILLPISYFVVKKIGGL